MKPNRALSEIYRVVQSVEDADGLSADHEKRLDESTMFAASVADGALSIDEVDEALIQETEDKLGRGAFDDMTAIDDLEDPVGSARSGDGLLFFRWSLAAAVVVVAAGVLIPSLKHARKFSINVAMQNDVRQMIVAIEAYVGDHQDHLPERLSDLAPYLSNDSERVMTNRRTGNAPGFALQTWVYRRRSDIVDPHSTPAIVELMDDENGAGAISYSEGEARIIGYYDGHVVVWYGDTPMIAYYLPASPPRGPDHG
ncbi:MAG: hypothetical protein CMJ18_15310 [Phycisphaeraceae bacterium]|nr:hypothetical protein [Phycisphaeraceae bacterium]